MKNSSFLKLALLTLCTLGSQTVYAEDLYSLFCYATQPVQDAQGNWYNKTIASDSKPLQFSTRTDGEIDTKNVVLNFTLNQEQIKVEGTGYMTLDSYGAGSIKLASVISKISFEKSGLEVLAADGMMVDITNAAQQGQVATSSATILNRGKTQVNFGCEILRKQK